MIDTLAQVASQQNCDTLGTCQSLEVAAQMMGGIGILIVTAIIAALVVVICILGITANTATTAKELTRIRELMEARLDHDAKSEGYYLDPDKRLRR